MKKNFLKVVESDISILDINAPTDICLLETLTYDKANKYLQAIFKWAERKEDVS